MPEIWLNYGPTDVVLDIMAENLGGELKSQGAPLSPEQVSERLQALEASKPMEMVAMHDTPAVRQVITAAYEQASGRPAGAPKVLADARTAKTLQKFLPEGCAVSPFDSQELDNSSLVFVAEAELDGLFGFETVSTRLARKFGPEAMMAAYAKRKGNMPAPGQPTQSLAEANKFADGFEIGAIEVASSSQGILDVAVGSPSSTSSVSRSLEPAAAADSEKIGSAIISTGKAASNDTLSRALNSLWGSHAAIKDGGIAVLLAECAGGAGSEAVQQYIEGRLDADGLRSPPKYIDGMESLLFLQGVQKSVQTCLVSVMPELYSSKLGLVPLPSAKDSLEYVLKARGQRHKVSVISDGSRLLLR